MPDRGFTPPPLTQDPHRLAALAACAVLDTLPEEGFDDIVALAASLCHTPVALVSFVDRDRQWFKARLGLDAHQTDLDSSVCAHALAEPDLLVVPDLAADPRTALNPLVTGGPHIRFYAGAPLRTREGHAIGSLCCIDTAPRPGGLTEAQADGLRRLGRQVMAQLELRRTAAERDEQQARHRQMMQSATDFAIIATDLGGRVLEWNTGAENILGWPAGEMLGRTLERIFTPEDDAAGRMAREMVQAAEQGRASDERWHLRQDGHRFWASGEMMPLRDAAERHIGYLKILRDQTEARAAIQRLADSEERLSTALDASNMIGVWDWDMAADLVYADANFARLYDVDAERAAAGAPLAEFVKAFHPDDLPAFQMELDRVLAGGANFSCEYRIRQPNGGVRWVLARGRVVRDHTGKPVRFPGASIDITEQKANEQRTQRANMRLAGQVARAENRLDDAETRRSAAEDQLRQSQKMEAVGQLTGGLAHDLNNMLASVSGALELMRRRAAAGRVADLERYVGIAEGATKRAAALTHRLLAFSRRQTLDPKPTDINRLVDGIADLVRRTAGPEIGAAFVLGEGLWPVLVDPHQLENALLNLCINARDAMPDGGRLRVETANQPIAAPTAAEWEMRPGDYVALYVSDTGCGMPAEVLARVFEPFFTTKPTGQGTGLGLSMVFGFARQSGGDVRIHSEPGRGTSVALYLPRHDVPESLQPDAAAAALEGGRGEMVLLVDDEESLRALVAEVLRDQGYRVLEAGDGAAALALLNSGARVDMLVTDVGLPGGMNGRQLADAARERTPGMPVLFITGYAEGALAGAKMQGEQGMQVMVKPFAMDALAAKVEAALRTR